MVKKDFKDIKFAEFLEKLRLSPDKMILHGMAMICYVLDDVAGHDKAVELYSELDNLIKKYIYSCVNDRLEKALDILFIKSMEHARKEFEQKDGTNK